MDYRKENLVFRQKLVELVGDEKQAEKICRLFEMSENVREQERREKQKLGIEKAKEKGVRLGRPRLEEPEDFPAIADMWIQKKINASEGARLCGMGVSTFYRRLRDYRDRMSGMEGGKELC